jgi:hypothetical protein
MKCCRCLRRVAFFIVGTSLSLTGRSLDAQKQQGPVATNPQAPTLTGLSTTGIQRGTTLEITLTGTNLANPTGVLTGFPAAVTIPEEGKNGKEPGQLHIHLEVPVDAPLGFHNLRLATTRGISNLRMFCIDDLPQVHEGPGNRDRSAPMILKVPCVVSGKVDAEKSSWFQITVKAGQRLSFDVLGRRLGGPIDPQLSLYDAKSKREIAYENDSPGCQSDPRLSYLFKTAGDYLIEVKDVLNRGGPDYAFRLRVGDFPLATVAIPMAIQRGQKASVGFAGQAVAGVAPVAIEGPTDISVQTLYVAPQGASGLHGWPVPLAVSDFPELLDDDSNHEPAKAIRLPVPGGITGRFLKGDQTNYYRFAAKKGQKLLIEAQTLELGSPTLVYMVLRNGKTNAEIAKTNPQAVPPADQVIDYTATEDGDYVVEVQHLNYLGGPNEAYHLTVTPSRPSFEVMLGLDRFDLPADGFANLPLQLKRNNFAGSVEVGVLGPMGFAGKGTIAANQTAGVLVLRADKELPMGPYTIGLVAEATIDKDQVKQLASVRTAVSQSLANLPFPPRNLYTQIAVGVREPDPFVLIARLDQNGCVPGLPANLTLLVQRGPGFDGEITLNPPAGLPPGVAVPKMPTIAKGKKEVKVKLDLPAAVPPGQYFVLFSGKGKQSGKDYTVAALPVVLDVNKQPFELETDQARVTLAAGSKTKIAITAIRKGGYDGPINVEVKNLPAKVKANTGTIAKGQNTIDLELTAAADAAEGTKMDVQIGGVATALGNAAGASPTFTLVVEKKQ